jgi:hypothetical protein
MSVRRGRLMLRIMMLPGSRTKLDIFAYAAYAAYDTGITIPSECQSLPAKAGGTIRHPSPRSFVVIALPRSRALTIQILMLAHAGTLYRNREALAG